MTAMSENNLQGLIVFRDGGWAEPEEPGESPSIDYALKRSQAERAAAERASSEAAKEAHQQLAQAYAKIARRA
jgi:hypothetical protein